MSMHRTLLPLGAALTLALACTVGAPSEPDGAGGGGPEPGTVFLEVEPAEVTLESVDGSMPTVTFRASTRSLGGERTYVADPTWSIAHDRVGTLDELGTFTASGRAGGTVTVTASVPGEDGPLVATATVTVRLDVTVPPPDSVPASVVDRFGSLPEVDDPFAAPTLLYPLDGARMPNNVGAPDVQWHPVGGAGDAFRITIASEHVTVRSFAMHDGEDFGSHHPVDPAAFRIVADSTRGAEVTVRVDRLPAGGESVVRGRPVTIWLSEDGIFGTLYYWQVEDRPERSDILRLDAATGERTPVFEPRADRCVGCHALSHDGRQLAATIGGTPVWATEVVDAASTSSPPTGLMDPLTPGFNSFAWNPDGGRILASQPVSPDRSDSRLYLLDGANGAVLEADGLPEGRAGYPAWSPDGALVAWIEGGGDGPEGTSAATRLVLAEARDGDTFEERASVDGEALSSTPEGGLTISRPTFSPDSRFVAFAHGTSSVSARPAGAPRPRSRLYLLPIEGGAPVRLDRGMGPEGPVDAFWPVFSPFVTQEADGTVHYWLAFYSRQGYGNAQSGTRDSDRRQLWVMAVDPELATDGGDPSYPPYWIPGQDTSADDIAALWAPTACRGRGESCSASSECCSGECAAADPARPDELTCQPPRTCRRAGESCETADDCCDGLECNLGVCGYEPPV